MDAARGALAWLLQRRWGLTAWRENARLLLRRLEYVGVNARVAAHRREAAEQWQWERARRRVLGLAGAEVAAGVLALSATSE